MRYLFVVLLAFALLALPIGYIRLCVAIHAARIQHPPYIHFLFVFAAIGALLLSVAFAGSVPGALLALLSAVLAPLLIIVSSCFLYSRHQNSRYHRAAYWSGMAYVAVMVLFVAVFSISG